VILSAILGIAKASLNTECMVKYLKGIKLLELSYPEAEGTFYHSLFCSTIIDSIKNQTETKLNNLLIRYGSRECLMNSFRRYNFADYLMKLDLLMNLTDTQEEPNKLELELAEDVLYTIVGYTSNDCFGVRDYLKRYVLRYLFDSSKPELRMKQRQYCDLKYVVNHNMIEVENVNFNPENITIEGLDCEDMLAQEKSKARKQFKIQAEDYISKNAKRCSLPEVMDRYDDSNPFDNIKTAEVLGRMPLSQEDVEKYRKKLRPQREKYLILILECFYRGR
jgi:hypothetical protein